ncbi:MAG: right-handed parallel beta-helix repeat-containing protein [Planctomycetota bacterium]
MLFRRRKSVSSVCPRTGKRIKPNTKLHWWIWLFPVTGLLSLIWFLIRVIPKPSRATYPCQRLAAPIASGFIVWLTGLIASTLAYRKARRLLHQSRYVLAGICATVAVMAIWWPLAITADKPAKAWAPTDPSNTPMGTAKGIYPGRVIWLHEPDATSWDGSTGSWWDDNNTDQAIVHRMVSKTVQSLTGQSNDPNAWDMLFRHFNQTHGFGNVGYTPAEKIAIKINMNQDSGGSWSPRDGMPSPHVIYSLLDQLIHEAGVSGYAITVYDASRYIGDPIYNKIKNNLNFQNVRFIVSPSYAYSGRLSATRDTGAIVHTSYPGCPNANMPLCVTQAKYLINMALLRPHSMYGITLSAKNHYGSVHTGSWSPSPLHYYGDRSRPMETYNCLVDLIGSQYLGGKTMLYMIDGLYGAQHQGADVIRYLSFGDDWCSSIFASQDPVAIDSVALDFMRNEPRCTQVTGNPDNYLHEAALANDPCSGTFYDPDHSGDITRLPSLGVHEHWNNATNKQYSRNLGTGSGIELLPAPLTPPDERIVNQTSGNRYEHIRYAISDAMPGDQIVVNPGIYLESFNFLGKNITLRSIDPNDPAVVAATVIKGRSYTPVVVFSASEGPTSVLAGLTITGGNSGILIRNSSPTITNCVITGNVSNGLGGGICCLDYSYPTIRNCTISDNSAVDGGGIYYSQPLPPPPPPFSASTSAADTFTATNCVITSNTAQRGGGMYNSGTSPTLTNCTFSSNFASEDGGCLYNYSSNPTLSNCILWGDTPDEIYVDGTGTTVVSYSDVQGDWPGTGNINTDPLFIDAEDSDETIGTADDNLRLSAASPCVDNGDNTSIPVGITTDLDGHPRIADGDCNDVDVVDMGAYEFNYAFMGDLDYNCRVDFFDFSIFGRAWMTEQGEPSWDWTCDISDPPNDYIDWRDVAVLCENWLEIP